VPPAGFAAEGNGHRGGGVLAPPNDVLAGGSGLPAKDPNGTVLDLPSSI